MVKFSERGPTLNPSGFLLGVYGYCAKVSQVDLDEGVPSGSERKPFEVVTAPPNPDLDIEFPGAVNRCLDFVVVEWCEDEKRLVARG